MRCTLVTMTETEISDQLSKIVYRPEDVPELKVRLYKEGQSIGFSIWNKVVKADDSLKALRDTNGKMWLALNARLHADITCGLRQNGIDIADESETRFQIQIDDKGKIDKIYVPFSITWQSERAARKLLQMIPIQAMGKKVRLCGSGMFKEIGADIISILDTESGFTESDPRVLKVTTLANGSKYFDIRVSLPKDLRE